MKKAVGIVASLLACVTLMVSCASAPAGTSAPKKGEPVYGADGDERPDWAKNMFYDADDGLYVVEMSKMSSRKSSMEAAKADGAAELSRTLMQTVKTATQRYLRDTNVPEDELQMIEQASVSKSEALLVGAKTIGTWVAADETVYILYGIPNGMQAIVDNINTEAANYAESAKTKLTVKQAKSFIEEAGLNE